MTERVLPLQHARATPWPAPRLAARLPAVPTVLAVLTALAVLAVLPAVLPALLRAQPLAPTAPAPIAPARDQRDLHDLGNHVCMPHGAFCAQVWRAGLQGGVRFNELISEVCLHVGLREDEDAGIACAERAIRAVPSLPDGVLVRGQFAPGERAANEIWQNQSNRDWGATVTRYFLRIPAYCDNATPEIFDYFPCLLRRVHSFQHVLKRYRIR